MTTSPPFNFKHCYHEDGAEDLEGSYRRAVRNVRIYIEWMQWSVEEAVEEVSKRMSLTFAEYTTLLSEAQQHYGKDSNHVAEQS